MNDLTSWQWAWLGLGSLLIGFSKTGIAGIGALAIAIFAIVLGPLASTGQILPLLVAADIVAVLAYRQHGNWVRLLRLLSFAVPGVIAGWVMMQHMNNTHMKHVIGSVLLTVVTLHVWRRRTLAAGRKEEDLAPHSLWFAAATGLLAGVVTMLANAAGAIVVLYLLAMRTPKMEFLGTCAWYFFLLNLFKVPFSWGLGLIHFGSLRLDLILVPWVLLGAIAGRLLISRINQGLFEWVALSCTVFSALYLLR